MKPKTYNYKGKTVIAVPETFYCDGCIFNLKDDCGMAEGNSLNQDKVQAANGMPICLDEKIIFKLATDEKQG